ncbi:Metallo-dependent hydrolase [Ramicandelaber brevisporus]|nr:Metallo-dependent hydrolase [Ramicandelaber brevisporus]
MQPNASALYTNGAYANGSANSSANGSNTNTSNLKVIYNCRILRDHAIVEDEQIWIHGGKIVDPRPFFFDRNNEPIERIDAKGALVVPGFIDIQINGAFGVDFTRTDDPEGHIEGLEKVYHNALPHLGPRTGSAKRGAHVLGAHVEGPFINPAKRGAHEPETLRDAKNGGMADFDDCYNLDNLRRYACILTVAPEVDGVLECIPKLSEQCNIVVSQGHSAAETKLAEHAVANGIRCITHLFNAMRPFNHRNPGIIGLLGSASRPRPYYGIICDGIHVHPNSIKIAYYAHPKGAIIITDAISSMGLAPGKYTLGKMCVEKFEDRALIEGTETLAGVITPMNECVRNFIKYTECSLVEAIEAATLHPAKLLGIQKTKGTLAYGADADLIFIDDEVNVLRTFVLGEEAHI